MKITARTPNRIDLAGGTLDIYPLYIFLQGGYTLNAAIDLYSDVEIETRDDDLFVLESQDLNERLEISRQDLEAGEADQGPFRLIVAALRYYQPATGLRVVTHNGAPKGSGLGASSALLIALSGALDRLNRSLDNGETLIRAAADLEAWTIGIPTGKQDYYAALYGGLQALHFNVRGVRRERLNLSAEFMQSLNAGLLLSFTGESHFSGTNNWNMTKRYVDDMGDSRAALKAIQATSLQLYNALKQEDLDAVYALLNQEWHNRKSLADGVTTPQIERMIAAAKAAGAQANKICGAGGGGCLLTLCPPDKRAAVEKALGSTGAQLMQHRMVGHGLQIQEID